MICPNCGKEVNEGAKFCTGCGFALSQQPSMPPQPTAQPPVEEVTVRQTATPQQPAMQTPAANQSYPPQSYPPQPYPYQQNPAYRQMQGQPMPGQPMPQQTEPKKEKNNTPLILGIVLGVLLVIILVMVLMLTDAFDKIGSGKKENKKAAKQTESSLEDEEIASKADEESEKESSKDEAKEETAAAAESDQQEKAEESKKEEATPEESSVEAIPMVETAFGSFESTVKDLDLTGVAVDSLEGVDQLKDLESIVISGGALTDVTPLGQLTNLKTIVLNNVPVTDILPLAGLVQLETLNIADTQVNSDNAKAFLEQSAAPNLSLESYIESQYMVVEQPLSWTEADIAASEGEGHLAVINSEKEYNEIVKILDNSGLIYVWLGAWYADGAWYTVTGEPFEYAKWYPGEPSGKDNDGTVEDKLCIWYLDGSWTENDQRDNLNTFLGNSSHYLGYLVEYELPTGINPNAN